MPVGCPMILKGPGNFLLVVRAPWCWASCSQFSRRFHETVGLQTDRELLGTFYTRGEDARRPHSSPTTHLLTVGSPYDCCPATSHRSYGRLTIKLFQFLKGTARTSWNMWPHTPQKLNSQGNPTVSKIHGTPPGRKSRAGPSEYVT